MKDHHDLAWYDYRARQIAKMAEEDFGIVMFPKEISAISEEIYRQVTHAKINQGRGR